MDHEDQRHELDANYAAFEALLPSLLPLHRGKYALMRGCRIVGFFDRPGHADRAGRERFADEIFPIQEVDDEPVFLR